MKIIEPSIILVRPQLPENIGFSARAMQNFGFKKLILVSPREEWPNEKAYDVSANANKIIEDAKIFTTLSKALKSFSQGNMGYYLKNISKFKFPIIIINGVEDDKYVNLGRQLDTFSRSSKQHIILECGHNVHFEKCDDFISILADL